MIPLCGRALGSGRFGVELPPLMDRDIGRPMES